MSFPGEVEGAIRQIMADNPVPIITNDILPEEPSVAEATRLSAAVLEQLNHAIAARDTEAVKSLLLPQQTLWKDSVALTYHLRTFYTAETIAKHIVKTADLRQLGEFRPVGEAIVNPLLKCIDCRIAFTTGSPAAEASGKFLLLPVKDGVDTQWKIWVLFTRLENLNVHPEDVRLLKVPARPLTGDIETDVFIIGAGNSAALLTARLKALGVEAIMADRNARIGDNWRNRYDSMRFHVPTTLCTMPYLPYDNVDARDGRLARDVLANHICRYFDELNLPVLLSTTIRSATYAEGRWTIKLTTPDGPKTIVAKQLVQATGLGSQTPRIPDVPDEGYTGLSIHSTQYKSPEKLKAAGVSSVIVVGAANTAFDVLRDCADASLNPIMVARSPTYLLPVDYLGHPAGVGAYDVMPLDDADRRFFSMPVAVEAFLAKALLSSLARDDQDRYTALKRAGFPVLDSAHPDTLLTHHLLERAGGHYIDIGGTRALEDGTATVKAGVDIVAKTERGLRFADGSTLEADAVIWCTGFVDVDATDAISPIIGDDLASRLGPTWGIDAEGEVRGVWKRTPVPNFWVMGGFTQLQRWHSRTLALQIKADLEAPGVHGRVQPAAES